MKLRLSIMLMGVTASSAVLCGEITLKGVMISNGEPLFSLYSVEEQTSKWIKLGQTFSGFKALSFDPANEVLVVEQGDVRQNLRLQVSSVKDSSAAEAKARLHSLKGIELAHELARQGDVEIERLLAMYQSIATRVAELKASIAAQPSAGADKNSTNVNPATEFLTRRLIELRTELEATASKKAAQLLAPAKLESK